MILKIINVFPPSIRENLNDKKLVELFDKLEQDPEECCKATALELVKVMGDDYKSQIEKLHSTDLNFLYIVKDENKGYYYIYSPSCDTYYIDINDIFNNDAVAFKELGDIFNMIPYYALVIYAII